MVLHAYVDESFHEDPTNGAYVLAATVIDSRHLAGARALLAGFHGKVDSVKAHWHDMQPATRKDAAAPVAEIGDVHVVVIGVPTPTRRQERARAVCLRAMLMELRDLRVDRVIAESRSPVLDERDVRVVRDTRHALRRYDDLRIDHVRGSDEPLLWAADFVAGAVRGRQSGGIDHTTHFAAHVYEMTIATGC